MQGVGSSLLRGNKKRLKGQVEESLKRYSHRSFHHRSRQAPPRRRLFNKLVRCFGGGQTWTRRRKKATKASYIDTTKCPITNSDFFTICSTVAQHVVDVYLPWSLLPKPNFVYLPVWPLFLSTLDAEPTSQRAVSFFIIACV